MKKAIFSFLLLLLSLTACNARSEAPDAQQAAQPQAETALPVDVSTLPEGQCYRQTPYLNPIGISQPDGECVWNGKVYSFSNAPAKLGVTDANGNSEALELPDAEYIYGVCENGDTLAVLAGADPLFFAGTDDEQSVQASGDDGHAIYLYDKAGNLTGSIPQASAAQMRPMRWIATERTSFYCSATQSFESALTARSLQRAATWAGGSCSLSAQTMRSMCAWKEAESIRRRKSSV